jgi:hypothetical protein
MKLNYLVIMNDFFTKRSSYDEFKKDIINYINSLNAADLEQFYNYIIDDNFSSYDPDMVMLFYLTIWFYDNNLKRTKKIVGADNMYTSFIKSIFDSYPNIINVKEKEIVTNFNYSIILLDNIYLIINKLDVDIEIKILNYLNNKDKYFCLNCGDEIKLTDSLELYPYGFYILEKIKKE